MNAPDSFLEIYHQHVDFVWRYAAALGVPRDLVPDVAQEVFLVVLRRLETFEHRSHIRTWIGGITINVVRAQRRRSAEKAELLEPASADLMAPGPSPEKLAELKSAEELVQLIVDQMTELQREVFVLVELEEVSVVDAAAMLGVNENTLRTRLRAARQMFNRAVQLWGAARR